MLRKTVLKLKISIYCKASATSKIFSHSQFTIAYLYKLNISLTKWAISTFKEQIQGVAKIGIRKTKIDIECQAKRSSSKECLKRFKTLDDGQRKSFIEGMMDELRDKELEILCGTFGRKSSEDLKKEASIRKIYRN